MLWRCENPFHNPYRGNHSCCVSGHGRVRRCFDTAPGSQPANDLTLPWTVCTGLIGGDACRDGTLFLLEGAQNPEHATIINDGSIIRAPQNKKGIVLEGRSRVYHVELASRGERMSELEPASVA